MGAEKIPKRALGSPPSAVQPGIQPRDGKSCVFFSPTLGKKLGNRSPLPNSKRLDWVWEGGAASSRQTGPCGGTPAGRRFSPTEGAPGEEMERSRSAQNPVARVDWQTGRWAAWKRGAGKPPGTPQPVFSPAALSRGLSSRDLAPGKPPAHLVRCDPGAAAARGAAAAVTAALNWHAPRGRCPRSQLWGRGGEGAWPGTSLICMPPARDPPLRLYKGRAQLWAPVLRSELLRRRRLKPCEVRLPRWLLPATAWMG